MGGLRPPDRAGRRLRARTEPVLPADRPEPERRRTRGGVPAPGARRPRQGRRFRWRSSSARSSPPFRRSPSAWRTPEPAAWCSSTGSTSRTSTWKSWKSRRSLKLSTSDDLLLPLRWIAILYGRVKVDLALTGGVHTGQRPDQSGDGRRERRDDRLGTRPERACARAGRYSKKPRHGWSSTNTRRFGRCRAA